MSRDPGLPNVGSLKLEDEDPEGLFDSPDTKRPGLANGTKNEPDYTSSRTHDYDEDNQNARETVLRKELEGVRHMNEVIEDLIGSLQKAKDSTSALNDNVHSASTLLNTWTRILSQTEHNQRLLLDPEWHGATQDLESMENESILRQQAEERRAIEEQSRREAMARQAEEEDRKRTTTPSKSRGSRGRVRGTTSTRGSTTGSIGSNTSSQTTRGRPAPRTTSGIGRGVGSGRARGRGAV